LLASFLLRAAALLAAGSWLWGPARPLEARLLAAVAEPLLLLMDTPPLVTSLEAHGQSILFYSFLTGFGEPMAAWSLETMGVFVLAPLVVTLAVPGLRWRSRLVATGVALGLACATTLAIAVTQIQLAVAAHASRRLGITVHAAAERARLETINTALHVIGMLALPALLFLASYAYVRWLQPEVAGGRPGGRRRGLLVAATVVCGALILWGGLAAQPPASRVPADYHRGWSKVLLLNPAFAPAQVNVGLHLLASGHADEAAALFRAALETRPDLVEAHYNLGNALSAQGLDQAAVASYVETLKLAPGNAAARRNLGLALARLGRACDAASQLETSARLEGATDNVPLARDIARLRAACAE